MPAIYDMKPTPVFAGMLCDVCKNSDTCSDFVLRHTFGYGSLLDGDQVEAAICDDCLEKIIRLYIPGAIWTDAQTREREHEK